MLLGDIFLTILNYCITYLHCIYYCKSKTSLWWKYKNLKHLFPDVYVDEGKKSYAALNFKRMNFLQMFPAVLSAAARAAASRAKSLKLVGNMSGDGWQNGGCLVIEKGGSGKPLLYYIQESAPAIVDNSDVLKVK